MIDLKSIEFNGEEYNQLREYIVTHQSSLQDLKVEDSYVYKKTMPSDGNTVHEAFI